MIMMMNVIIFIITKNTGHTFSVIISEFRDVVFEDVAFDNDRCFLIIYLDFA